MTPADEQHDRAPDTVRRALGLPASLLKPHTAAAAATRVFIVAHRDPAGSHWTRRVEAATYQDEDGLIVFRDPVGEPAFTVQKDLLSHVERAEGADPVVAEFMRLAALARTHGHASGKFMWEGSEQPGDPFHRTYVDITVVAAPDGQTLKRLTDQVRPQASFSRR